MTTKDAMMVSFRLPWPPSSDNLYTPMRGRLVLKKAGRVYQEAVKQAVWLRQIEKAMAQSITADPGFRVMIEMRGPSHDKRGHRLGLRHYDIANREKACMDALTRAGVWDDDSGIDRLVLERGEQDKDPHVIVTIARKAVQP